ncbi:MAG: response regulator transcription factor [Methylophilaceae bacterium]
MEKKHTILIVEDHTLLRHGLVDMILSDPTMEVIGEVDNGRDAVTQAKLLEPDLVLMDINLPLMNGTEALSEIKRTHPKIKIMVLTVHKADEYVRDSLRSGADGYLLKNATRDEFVLALHQVLKGKQYLSAEISANFEGVDKTNNVSDWERLSNREREVLKLVAEGYTNKQIASVMFISIKTVEKHRSNLMLKLNLHNSSSLTAYAIENKLVTIKSSI